MLRIYFEWRCCDGGGVNTGTVIAGGNLKIENKNTVSHGVNETAVNYVVTATGLNLLGAMNANAGWLR